MAYAFNENKTKLPVPGIPDFISNPTTDTSSIGANASKEYTVTQDCYINIKGDNVTASSYGMNVGVWYKRENNEDWWRNIFMLESRGEDHLYTGIFPVTQGTKLKVTAINESLTVTFIEYAFKKS